MKNVLDILQSLDPADMDDLSKEKLVNLYNAARDIQGIANAQKKVLGKEILDRIEGDGEVIGDYSVTRVTRYSFRTPIKKARELGATKETVDNKVLKALVDKGKKVPGANQYSYPLIKSIKDE